MRFDGSLPASDALALLVLPFGLLAVFAPGAAVAHGGTTIAEGRSKGVTVIVQGSETESSGGDAQVDLATTLAGPGTGPSAKVVYYVRPAGKKRSERVPADRDASGVRHAEIPASGRGDWRRWDVSAIVTLASGKKLRVASTSKNPPGPDPVARQASRQPAAPNAPTSAADKRIASPREDAAAVDDISGQQEAAPSWAVPSVVGMIALGLLGFVATRRRRR